MLGMFRSKSDGANQGDGACDARSSRLFAALDRHQAVIEFSPDGKIIEANQCFLRAMGYNRTEIVGQHHRMFVDPTLARSDEYSAFWESLRRGEAMAGEFQRLKKDGSSLWLQATYCPIQDASGRVTGVVKSATDITPRKLREAARINDAYASIEFTPDGTIVSANDHFLRATGYQLDEVVGHHHRMFVERDYAQSQEYAQFWENLRRGQSQQGEFHRITKSGEDLWLQASYGPEMDPQGRVLKVVKLASDVTAACKARSSTEATSHAIASGLQELSAAAGEISSNVASSANLAEAVRERTDNAARTVESLHEASEKVGEVMSVIGSLADQTNLLALNATIESARAGEAGKGFAVVASEVKELARQTKGATERIGEQIGEIQTVVGTVVTVVSEIQEELNKVSDNTSTVASAVEEQTSVITDLSSEAERLAL